MADLVSESGAEVTKEHLSASPSDLRLVYVSDRIRAITAAGVVAGAIALALPLG
jgi:hypothetical protein